MYPCTHKILKSFQNEMVSMKQFKEENDWSNFIVNLDETDEKQMVKFNRLSVFKEEIKITIANMWVNLKELPVNEFKIIAHGKEYEVLKFLTYGVDDLEIYLTYNLDGQSKRAIALISDGNLILKRELSDI